MLESVGMCDGAHVPLVTVCGCGMTQAGPHKAVKWYLECKISPDSSSWISCVQLGLRRCAQEQDAQVLNAGLDPC